MGTGCLRLDVGGGHGPCLRHVALRQKCVRRDHVSWPSIPPFACSTCRRRAAGSARRSRDSWAAGRVGLEPSSRSWSHVSIHTMFDRLRHWTHALTPRSGPAGTRDGVSRVGDVR
jgi:hypothetical protein